MVYWYIFSGHTTWCRANITHAPREKEGAENPVLERRAAGGGRRSGWDGWVASRKSHCHQRTSLPPYRRPDFSSRQCIYTRWTCIMHVYIHIYTAIYIHTVKSSDPTRRRRGYPSSPRSTPAGPRTAPRQRTFTPCLENGRRLAIVVP